VTKKKCIEIGAPFPLLLSAIDFILRLSKLWNLDPQFNSSIYQSPNKYYSS